jgi:hypothetical protein
MRAPDIAAGRWLLSLALLGWPTAATAGDVGLTARVWGGTTDVDNRGQNFLSQEYRLSFRQPVTPNLAVLVAAQGVRFDSRSEQDVRFDRRSTEPFLEVSYVRPTFNGRLIYIQRNNDGTSPADQFESESLVGQFAWQPGVGPQYSLRVLDASNVADTSVFGRDIDTKAIQFETSYFRSHWSARYEFEDTGQENTVSGASLDQRRHTVRGTYDDLLLAGRLSLSADLRVSRTSQQEEGAEDTFLGEQLRASEGLFALDLTPAVGALLSVPTLVDGDFSTPATVPIIGSPIEIGGANTFRNIGADLGLSQAVSRLEVTVNTDSGPNVAWEVYHSPDNLNWTRIGGETSRYERAPLFRYVIDFPQTEERFFKVVNVTANPEPVVLVTEIRALVDVEVGSGQATNARVTFLTRWTPVDRLTTSLALVYDDDRGSGRGLPQTESRESSADALVSYQVTPTLEARGQIFVSRFERLQTPVLQRQEQRASAGLAWSPLPTAVTVFRFSRRDELEGSTLLRRSDTIRARGTTDLLPGLQVISELVYNSVDDRASAFTLRSIGWSETVDTRLTSRLSLFGGFSIKQFLTTGTVSINQRVNTYWRLRWIVIPSLSFTSDWNYGREDDFDSWTQRYSLGWAPGPRLTTSVSYNSVQSRDLATSNVAGSANYRLNRFLNLFATFSRSSSERGVLATRVTNLQLGSAFTF